MSEDRFDGIKMLGAVSRLSETEARKIFEEVKANLSRLDACSGPHDFQPIEPKAKLVPRYRCTKCGGEIEGTSRSWYERGLKHGRQSP